MGQCFVTEYDEQRRANFIKNYNKRTIKRTIMKKSSTSSNQKTKTTCII